MDIKPRNNEIFPKILRRKVEVKIKESGIIFLLNFI
jgi:hypothetical protein